MSNQKQDIIWQLIAQMALLLVLYAGAYLLTALKFLADDPLAVALPYSQISSLSHIFLDLALLSGLIAVALYYAVDTMSNSLIWAYRAWTALLILAVFAGMLGWLEGRHLLELPFLLDSLLIIALILWIIVIWQGSQLSETKTIFLIGMIIITIAFALSFLPVNPVQDRLLRVVMVNMRFFLGYGLCGLAVVSWLKRSESSPLLNAAILILVGTLLSLIPLTAVGIVHFPAIITVPIIFLGTLFITQNSLIQGQSWVNSGLLFLLIGMGILGAILAIPTVGQFALGTHLSHLPFSLVAWAGIVFVFGAVSHWLEGTRSFNSISATSWSFKLIIAGLLASQFALLIVGVVQVYMERILSLGYLNSQNTLIPLYLLWITASLVWAIGIAFYSNQYLNSANHLVKP
jgi:nitric oxide reductase subunit B